MTKEELKKLNALKRRRQWAIRQELSMSNAYRYAADEELLRVCNGVGNDQMWWLERRILTFIYRVFEVCADIHDFRYEYANGLKKQWHAANREMKQNMAKVIKIRFPLKKGKYFENFIWRIKAKTVMMGLSTRYSWQAWMDATVKRRKRIIEKMLKNK